MVALTSQTLTMTKGVTFYKSILFSSAPGAFIPPTWVKTYLTVKEHLADTDALCVLQIMVSNPGVAADGILYLDETAATALIQAYGSLVVNAGSGTVEINITDNGTVLIPRGRYAYDAKCILADGSSVVLVASSICYVSDTETLTV